jgi:DNA-binding winged helix-turn-helix (wHTH) protein
LGKVRYRFGEFELDRGAYQLRRGRRAIPLERIPLDLIFLLVERNGEAVTREEILERVWGKGVFLDTENAINTAVRKLRHALGDEARTPKFIETVHGYGYRFAPSVSVSRSRLRTITIDIASAVADRVWAGPSSRSKNTVRQG